ncbi:TlpA family protein disulfide reductase [Chitinophaga barathri]|uniref:Thioredoxin domain-containing protein n=1 Tax=Chitinophaga barathri TaxID=1647451 RepID=A0A3N4M792_9BACT|nr:redoxin domain-containing protein [Chitinophaga barathri]RPD39324.1 hypothetical protein EG028_19550 [Chitinophaga barathri]
MKRYYIIVLLLSLALNSYSQAKLSPLKIGDQMPDIPLGTVMDSKGNVSDAYQGKTKFSDFRGKLLIFDTWQTWCSSCIAGFPKMSKLQEKYRDRIQIFLVNSSSYEDQKMLKNWLALRKGRIPAEKSVFPENLPILIGAKEIESLFPIRRGIGYHVWVDQHGKVALRGISENSNETKIEEFLSGKNISFVQDNAGKYNSAKPFFKVSDSMVNALQNFSVSFGDFTDEFADPYGTGVDAHIDTLARSKRMTYLNQTIHYLYELATREKLQTDSNIVFGKRIVFEVDDLSKYTVDKKLIKAALTDISYRKTGHCFEMTVPLETPDSLQKSIMLQSLNSYFNLRNGISGKVEQRNVKCYKLISKRNSQNLKTKFTEMLFTSRVKEKGQRIFVYKAGTVNEIFKHYFMFAGISKFVFPGIIINATGISGAIDLDLKPYSEMQSYEEVKLELNRHDLDIVEGNEYIDMLVITENNWDKKNLTGR